VRLPLLFHLSVYLTVAMATLGLGYAETGYLSEITIFCVPVLLLLLLGYALEGRWALSTRGSNFVAVAIAAASVGWLILSFKFRPPEWLATAPWPASVLPFAAPILMLLLLAKLYRPKQIADYWAIHLIGLIEVALTCVLALEPLSGVFLVAYLVSAIWSLMLFHQYQAQLAGTAPSAFAGTGPGLWTPWPRLGLATAARRSIGVAVLALLLFLLSPRVSTSQWQIQAPVSLPVTPIDPPQAQTGFANQIDLNHTGRLEVSSQVAMEVRVTDARGNPKADLSPGQRWRGLTLDTYRAGKWAAGEMTIFNDDSLPRVARVANGTRADLPKLGPEQYFLDFAPKASKEGELFLAEPVVVPRGTELPPVVFFGPGDPGLTLRDLTLHRASRYTGPARYRQVARPVPEDQLPLALNLTPGYYTRLLQQPVPWIRSRAERLLRELVDLKVLDAADVQRQPDPEIGPGLFLPRPSWPKVGHATAGYLAGSGEFMYSLDLIRKDRKADPAEDFLRNVKQGHCEHFATALTLLLRSMGIPARIVSGFRGAQLRGPTEGAPQDAAHAGVYEVLENQAHTWVEALVEAPGPRGQNELCWLSLDATPGGTETAVVMPNRFSWSRWWEEQMDQVRTVWRNFTLDSSSDPLQDVLAPMRERFSFNMDWGSLRPVRLGGGAWAVPWLWLTLPLGLLLVYAGVRVFRSRKRRRAPAARPEPEVLFYRRWLKVAARRLKLVPGPAQTAHEFAEHVRAHLVHRTLTATLADVPRQLARLYYRVRFGDQPLTVLESDRTDRELAELEAALAGRGIVGRSRSS
jgi:hypothetical protein